MEEKNRSLPGWARKNPVITCFLLVILYILLRRTTYWIFTQLLAQSTVTEWTYEIVDVVWPLIITIAFGCAGAYRKGGFLGTLRIGGALILYGCFFGGIRIAILFTEPGIEWQEPLMMLVNVIPMLFVGFREESVFRACAVNVMKEKYLKDRKGIIIITVVTALCFGIMHMQNVFIGQSFVGSVDQSANAACLGIVFAAVYLRGGSIWAMMLIHAFIDTGSMLSNLLTKTYHSSALQFIAGRTENTVDSRTAVLKAVTCVGYILVAFFIIRRSKCDEIIERYREETAGEK